MHLKFWTNIRLSDDLSFPSRLTLCVSKFFGTFILMSIGCLSCLHRNDDTPRQLAESAFGFGFAVLIAIQCYGHISGAHINPIITLAAVIRGLLPVVEVPFYLIGQFLGSLAGYGTLRLLIPDNLIFGKLHPENGVCAEGVSVGLSPIQGLFIETAITFILVSVACGIWDFRSSSNECISIKFGFTVAVIVFAAGPFTAAHMNPARTLGPAVLNGAWKHNWIFWVGPICGSLMASTLYSILYY